MWGVGARRIHMQDLSKIGLRGPGGEGAAPSGVSLSAPVMADLMSGPTAPLTKAFLFCGRQCLPVDWLLDPSHDLSHPLRQQSLAEQLTHVDFICAAMDCSTKSRAREIPRVFDDGRPAPRPLRSVEFPEGSNNSGTPFRVGTRAASERSGGVSPNVRANGVIAHSRNTRASSCSQWSLRPWQKKAGILGTCNWALPTRTAHQLAETAITAVYSASS